MENQGSEIPTTAAIVPEIVVTEPSPLVPTPTPVIPPSSKVAPVPEEKSKQEPEVSRNATTAAVASDRTPSEQATSVPEPEGNNSGEFVSAQECNECVVHVPQPTESTSVEDETTVSSETDQDEFRTARRWFDIYDRLWDMLHSPYTIPFWLVLLALPLSAGIMGALHMYSCPAGHATPTLVFTIGVCLMAAISLRVCIIIQRTDEGRDVPSLTLHMLHSVATFLVSVFFMTESVTYWRMDSTSSPGTEKYCDPHFITFSFWWNCIMWFVMVLIVAFPA